MKKLVMLSMILATISCSEKNEDNPVATVNATGIKLSVTNENGADLLNPNNPNAYLEENIRLFYLINGQVEEVYDGNLDNPRHFSVFHHESKYRIGIGLNENGQPSTTHIKWNDTDTDTIKAEFRRWGASSIQVLKVWYNGDLKWEFSSQTAPHFEIVK